MKKEASMDTAGKSIFMDIEEVKAVLGLSRSRAYQLVQILNEEMQAEGFLTIRGRANRRFLEDRLYLHSSSKEQKSDGAV